MTKKQKLDKLLEIVGQLVELTTFDNFIDLAEKRSVHYMSDATYEALEALHEAYRDIDFFKYETLITRGISAGAEAMTERRANESN